MSLFSSKPASDERAIARALVRRADAARDARQFAKAAILYEEALLTLSDRGDLHVQHGHMLKESGALSAAAEAYARAAEHLPNDADLALQRGHLFKSQGQLARAEDAYREALRLKPGWSEPARELEGLAQAGWQNPRSRVPLVQQGGSDRARLFTAGEPLQLSAELAPGNPVDALPRHSEEIAIRGLGRRERTAWGIVHTLRGVRALRGFCISAQPVLTIELFLNGQLIHRGGLKGGFVLPHERDNPDLRKYTFNAWIDLTGFVTARYELLYRATRLDGSTLTRTEQIVIAPPFPPSPLPDSDDAVPPADPRDPRSLDDQVNARPSMIREGRRALLSELPKTVLVMRPDVLGDLVVAVPALRRLRTLLPGARFVGLLSPANVDFARTLGLFDEILVTELVFDAWERRRVVTGEAQAKLAEELARYSFDMAIDLGTSGESRVLMPLSGAPVLVGFSTDKLPNLTVEVAGAARDPYNGIETVPHTNQAMGLVMWLEAQMRSELNLLRRDDLAPNLLSAFGLAADARYCVLHAGGRWPFTRWPYFGELADMLLARTDLEIVLLTTDPDAEAKLPSSITGNARFGISNRRLQFDELDALVSYCTLFVGDDSGVKHLASMRGARVIGIQNARNNWSEWGQENGGYVVTRKVPCAGCLIQNYPESDDCGRDFVCITAIRPEEILEASLRLLELPA